MTATAETNPVGELLETLKSQAAAATLSSYGDLLRTVAALCVDGTIDEVGVTAIVDAIATGVNKVAGSNQQTAVRSIKKAMNAAIKQIGNDSGKNRQIAGANWEEIKCDQYGKPESSVHNARAGMIKLGIEFHYDRFTQKCRAEHEWEDEPTDAGRELRATIAQRLSKECAIEVMDDKVAAAIEQMASLNKHDSLMDAMDALPKWDKQERLDRWLIDYAGAEDNIYHREAGHVWLVAAIARAYIPGIKFDSAIILQGLQGTGKSTLLRILASDKLFTDDNVMTKANDSKHLIETTAGKWIVEIGELAGMHRSTVEDVKAMLSRTVDSARMAYGRNTEHRERRMVFAGSTNGKRYLRDETGGRRFWPIIVGKLDLAGLARDRDQLLAEAKLIFTEKRHLLEAAKRGEIVEPYPLQLNDPQSRALALQAQTGAFDVDTGWMETLEVMPYYLVTEKAGAWYVPCTGVRFALDLSARDWNKINALRAGKVMESLGWVRTENAVNYKPGKPKERCWMRTDEPQTRTVVPPIGF